MVVASLGLGLGGRISGGLILGAVVGQGVATLSFIRPWLIERRDRKLNISKERIFAVAQRYAHFAKYSLPGDTINVISGQMPVLILSIFFGPVIIGYFNVTQRVLAGPSSIISTAIGDVFRQRASEDRNAIGNFREIWLKTFKTLVLLSLPVYAVMAIIAPGFFAFVFGEQWRTAGEYAQIMSPFFMLSFTASILSRTTYIAEKQKQDMLWQIVLFLLITPALLIGAWTKQPLHSLFLYTLSYSVMYLIYLWMCFRYSGGDLVRQDLNRRSEAA
jgi:O-antigen/teichoic acid export membrane protein